MKMRLAIHGGVKAVSDEYCIFKHPIIDDEIKSAVIRQLGTSISIYDNGGIYSLLEKKLKEVFNLKNILTTNSGTTALFSLFYGYNFAIGDNVIVPSYTFFATAAPLINMGVQLRFADCLLGNGNIDPEKIKSKIDKRTKAIIVTHMWGIPCDMNDILKIGKDFGIPVLEDASHAHLAEYDGKIIGSFSDGAAWSLQGKKNLTAGEGGMLTSSNKRVMDRAVIAGHFNKRAKAEVSEEDLIPYAVTGSGYNFRMHPLGATIALHLLKKLESQTRDRREVADYIASRISRIKGLSNPRIPKQSKPAWYAYPILFDKNIFDNVSIYEFVKAINVEGAVEADVPSATGSMGRYKLFNVPSGINSLYQLYNYNIPDSKDFKNAELFQTAMFKIPTWYGEKRFEFAKAYLAAIEKVAFYYGK
jgi:perosamine synthetase